jgi:hypothetical protein
MGLMTSGCLIVRGGWTVITNLPPTEVYVTPRDVLVMDTEEQRALVQFQDPDGQTLIFTWLIDNEPVFGDDVETFQTATPEGALWSSRLIVRRQSVTEDSEVTVLVTDLEALVSVSWRVEVP